LLHCGFVCYCYERTHFGIFGFYSLPIRRAEFSAFIQAKGRLVRPRWW
jgi:hypothetical protein